VSLGAATLIVALDDPRVSPVLDDSLLVSPLSDPIFSVALDDSTNVVALKDASLTTVVL